MDLGLFVLLLQCVALLAKMCASQVLQASNGGFLKEKKMYLNVTVKEVHKVNRVAQCAVKSMRDHKSYSFNFAVKPDECGTYLCEVLYTDRYNDSDKYHKNENFDHYNKKSGCAPEPCQNGGKCRTSDLAYDTAYAECICPACFRGKNCELQDSPGPLGMQDGRILDSQLSASSKYDNAHGANFGRLHNPFVPSLGNYGCWAAKNKQASDLCYDN